MKSLILSVVLITTSAFGKTINCRVDEPIQNGLSATVPLNHLSGDEDEPQTQKVIFNGYSIEATFLDKSALIMKIDEDMRSIMYDVKLQGRRSPINVINYKDIRFQCWVE
jgi:hypothetical protein